MSQQIRLTGLLLDFRGLGHVFGRNDFLIIFTQIETAAWLNGDQRTIGEKKLSLPIFSSDQNGFLGYFLTDRTLSKVTLNSSFKDRE